MAVLENRLGLVLLTAVFVLLIFLYLPLTMSPLKEPQESQVEYQMSDQFRSDLLQLLQEAIPPIIKSKLTIEAEKELPGAVGAAASASPAALPSASSAPSKCPSQKPQQKPLPIDELSLLSSKHIDKLTNWNEWLWTDAAHDHLAADHLPASGLAPFTREAQRWIYEHQHPHDCKNAKFLIDGGWNGGIGSDMHVASSRLGQAIATGSIFIYTGNSDTEWTDDYICPGNRGFQNCYFRPVTNCTSADVQQGTPVDGNANAHAPVPAHLVKMLRGRFPAIKDAEIKYWWRAQSVTYLYRLSPRTMKMLRAIRFDKSAHHVIPDEPWAREYFLNKPYMPSGIVSAHVRHGDKQTEMQIQPWQKYIDTAEGMVRNMPNSVNRFMFLSTDDPQAIEEAKTYRPNGWAILYSEFPRLDRATSSHVNSQAMVHQIAQGHEGNITLLHFSQLLMALEADAWVGTRGSNWNRLIDELRCTLVPKCKGAYIEIGTNYDNYNWR